MRGVHYSSLLAARVPENDAMTPLLFAVVDVVLRQREARARQICGISAIAEVRWMARRRDVGWWRSTR